jgi:hypothetical protein
MIKEMSIKCTNFFNKNKGSVKLILNNLKWNIYYNSSSQDY